MRNFVKNNSRKNRQRPYNDLADEVFQRYFAGEDFIMNTATIAKRQGGEKQLEYWSDVYLNPLLPILHHPNFPSPPVPRRSRG